MCSSWHRHRQHRFRRHGYGSSSSCLSSSCLLVFFVILVLLWQSIRRGFIGLFVFCVSFGWFRSSCGIVSPKQATLLLFGQRDQAALEWGEGPLGVLAKPCYCWVRHRIVTAMTKIPSQFGWGVSWTFSIWMASELKKGPKVLDLNLL